MLIDIVSLHTAMVDYANVILEKIEAIFEVGIFRIVRRKHPYTTVGANEGLAPTQYT